MLRTSTVRDYIIQDKNIVKLASRYYAGETIEDAISTGIDLATKGLLVSFRYLSEQHPNELQIAANFNKNLDLLDALFASPYFQGAEISIKASTLGLYVNEDATKNLLATLCQRAEEKNILVMLESEPNFNIARLVKFWRSLQQEFSNLGITLATRVCETEEYCRAMTEGQIVRLSKGSIQYAGDTYDKELDSDAAYVRCLRALMCSRAYPVIATGDSRIISIAIYLANHYKRAPANFVFLMPYGVLPLEQRRLADKGYRSRVYIPFGLDLSSDLAQRIINQPSIIGSYFKAIVQKR